MCKHPEAHTLMLYSRKHYTHNRWNNDTKLACTKTGVGERQIGSKLAVRVFVLNRHVFFQINANQVVLEEIKTSARFFSLVQMTPGH